MTGKEKWPSRLKLISRNYQLFIFEGNICRRLVKISKKILQENICLLKLRLYSPVVNTVGEYCFLAERIRFDVNLHHIEQCLNFLDNVGTIRKSKI